MHRSIFVFFAIAAATMISSLSGWAAQPAKQSTPVNKPAPMTPAQKKMDDDRHRADAVNRVNDRLQGVQQGQRKFNQAQ